MLGPVLRKVLVVNFYSKGKIMNIKLTSLIASVALLSGVSVANAEGPLQLTEASMDGITAGSGYHHPTFEFTKYINTDVKHELDVYKDINTHVYVYGQLADAEAAASCTTYNCVTETLTVTNTGAYNTSSYSESISATSDGGYYFYGH
jgi:hypothetical protein